MFRTILVFFMAFAFIAHEASAKRKPSIREKLEESVRKMVNDRATLKNLSCNVSRTEHGGRAPASVQRLHILEVQPKKDRRRRQFETIFADDGIAEMRAKVVVGSKKKSIVASEKKYITFTPVKNQFRVDAAGSENRLEMDTSRNGKPDNRKAAELAELIEQCCDQRKCRRALSSN